MPPAFAKLFGVVVPRVVYSAIFLFTVQWVLGGEPTTSDQRAAIALLGFVTFFLAEAVVAISEVSRGIARWLIDVSNLIEDDHYGR